ncbi:unnamed protein product [Symbiodinium sp. CCMP2592]|nr:unnamed protein product [Symbiodinium sp. CCMP2592]
MRLPQLFCSRRSTARCERRRLAAFQKTPNASMFVKPSEYVGDAATAVVGRVVLKKFQKVPSSAKAAARPVGGKNKGGRGSASADRDRMKLEVHLAGSHQMGEVLFVEAWADLAEKLDKRLEDANLVALSGFKCIQQRPPFSTSRLNYYLCAQGTYGVNTQVRAVEDGEWHDIPSYHPVCPLAALQRVTDRQQICVMAKVVDNPGVVERATTSGTLPVCNAVVQQGATKVRCAFWRELAEQLAAISEESYVYITQVYCTKRGDESWELTSGTSTAIHECTDKQKETVQREIDAAEKDGVACKMLTSTPGKDWLGCAAVPCSLSALQGTIVAGAVRKSDTVFEIFNAQIVGVNSVRTETDDWVLTCCGRCKRLHPCQAQGRRAVRESRKPRDVMFVF